MSVELFWALMGGLVMAGVVAVTWCAVYLPGVVRKARVSKRIEEVAIVRAAMLEGGAVQQIYARSVDRIDITNIVDTGLTTAIKRYTFNLEFWWTDADGAKRHFGPTQYTWPNDLSDVPARIVKRWATELVTQAIRWRLGIEPVPET